MDKNPGVTCVVNKTNIIDSTYRNFEMEVLAGESNLVTKVQASSPWCFQFNVLNPKGILCRGVMQGCCWDHSCAQCPSWQLSEPEGWLLLLHAFVLVCQGQTQPWGSGRLVFFQVHSLDLVMWIWSKKIQFPDFTKPCTMAGTEISISPTLQLRQHFAFAFFLSCQQQDKPPASSALTFIRCNHCVTAKCSSRRVSCL